MADTYHNIPYIFHSQSLSGVFYSKNNLVSPNSISQLGQWLLILDIFTSEKEAMKKTV